MPYVKLSDRGLSKEWINQFNLPEDRNVAKKLLNSLKYVSNREFEDAITLSLLELQKSIRSRIAVYPIVSPPPRGVKGYDLFNGYFPDIEKARGYGTQSKWVGKRHSYGSEDRVGHLLERICDSKKGGSVSSNIECVPTITSLRQGKIKHIVLVDDICGSGRRVIDFYNKVLPAELKSQIIRGELQLWIVFYAVNKMGISNLKKKVKYFSLNKRNIRVSFPELDALIFDQSVKDLCAKYSKIIYDVSKDGRGLGYKNSIGGVVFEHGCPNNLPDILWKTNGNWKGIFENRAIPSELKASFDTGSTAEIGEVLWGVGQNNLALSLYDAMDIGKLSVDMHLIIGILGLLLRRVSSENIAGKLLIEFSRYQNLVQEALKYGLLEPINSSGKLKVSALGRSLVQKFRSKKTKRLLIAREVENYYPTQCDGHFQILGSLPLSKRGSTV